MPLKYFLLGALALAAVIFTLWIQQFREDIDQLYRSPTVRLPEYELEKVMLTTTDPNGAIQYTIEAQSLKHYVDGSHFLHPQLEFFGDNKRPMQVTSEQAWVTNKHNEIYLPGNVDIAQPADSQGYVYTVKTRDVTILPEQKMASTNAHLMAIGVKYWFEGSGGDVNLVTGDVKIRQQARGHYEP